jgi:hypothetical protein
MNMLKGFVLATALATVLGCGGGGGGRQQAMGAGGAGGSAGQDSGGAGAGGAGGVTLVGWVDDLAEQHTNATDPPDTVEDKVGVIIDTDDPAAFDPLLQKQAP